MLNYIDYRNANEFYTIDEVCNEFDLSKKELQHYSEKYKILPKQDQCGNYDLRKVRFFKLHNFVYKEQKYGVSSASQTQRKDPWA